MKYRKDIDGLRSLAILPVVAYHAGLPVISGGFTGVDVFFVISGFLITSVILSKAEKQDFSFLDFYFRRAKRLLPALFFMILLTAIGSLFILYPTEYKDFSTSSLMATFFVSNIYFDQTIDYFSASADTLPLLHTWSLAVEEQFYIFWPFLIMFVAWLLSRGQKKIVWILILSICALSLFVAQIAADKFPQHAFYLTPFRLWELGAGGVLVLLMKSKDQLGPVLANSLFGLGFVLVCFSMVWLSKDAQFPGVSAIPVVLGTFLMLWTGNMEGQRLAKVFHFEPLVYIGKISYSLYLMHWPIFALYRVYAGGEEGEVVSAANGLLYTPSFLAIPLVLVALAFLLASFSYHFVEQPVRFKWSKGAVWTGAVTGALVVATSQFSAVAYGGYDKRVSEEALPAYAADRTIMWEWDCNGKGAGEELGRVCHIGQPWASAKKRYILWGDSHSDHFAPIFEYAAGRDNVSIIQIGGCPPYLDDKVVRRWHKGATQFSEQCGKQQQKVLTWMNQNRNRIDGIFLASAWSGYPGSLFEKDPEQRSREEGYRLTEIGMKALLSKIPDNIDVVVISDVPRPNKGLQNCILGQGGWVVRATGGAQCAPLQREEIDQWHAPTTAALAKAAKSRRNARFIDSVDQICGAKDCPIFIGDRLIYRDGNHIRRNLNDDEKAWFVDRLKLREFISE